MTTVETKACPWCEAVDGYRAVDGPHAARLMRRILWQSVVLSFTDIARHPLAYVPAVVGAKGKERMCRHCDGLVRICPSCDAPHRWLSAGLLVCDCGYAFL